MSLLKTIEESLESNPEVVMVRSPLYSLDGRDHTEDLSSLTENGLYNYTANFFVAPKDGIYTAEGLQEFMIGLIPDVEPYMVNGFSEPPVKWRKTRDPACFLGLGDIYYRERLGSIKETTLTSIEFEDADLAKLNGFRNKHDSRERAYSIDRKIKISPFPNEKIGRNATHIAFSASVKEQLDEFLKSDIKKAVWLNNERLSAQLYVHLDILKEYRPDLKKVARRGEKWIAPQIVEGLSL